MILISCVAVWLNNLKAFGLFILKKESQLIRFKRARAILFCARALFINLKIGRAHV